MLAATDADGDTLAFRITDDPDHGTLSGTAPEPDLHAGAGLPRHRLVPFHDERHARRIARRRPSRSRSARSTTARRRSPTRSRAASAGPSRSRRRRCWRTTSPGRSTSATRPSRVTAVTATPDTHGTVSLADGAVTYVPDAGFTGTAKVLYTALRQRDDERPGRPALQPTASSRSSPTWLRPPRAVGVHAPQHGRDDHARGQRSRERRTHVRGRLGTGARNADRHRRHARVHAGNGLHRLRLVHVHGRGRLQQRRRPQRCRSTSPRRLRRSIKPDAVATAMNTSVLIDVLANDTAAAGSLDPATLAVVVPPTNGTAVVEGSQIRYTPAAGVDPSDHFTYKVCDTFGVCGQAEVTVSATVPNRPPVAQAGQLPRRHGATLDVAAPGLLGNDSDPDPGDRMQAHLGTGVHAGNLLLRSDGSFRYTPGPGFAGLDSFTYFVDRPRRAHLLAGHGHDRRRPARAARGGRHVLDDGGQPADGDARRRARQRPRRALDRRADREARPRAVPRHRQTSTPTARSSTRPTRASSAPTRSGTSSPTCPASTSAPAFVTINVNAFNGPVPTVTRRDTRGRGLCDRAGSGHGQRIRASRRDDRALDGDRAQPRRGHAGRARAPGRASRRRRWPPSTRRLLVNGNYQILIAVESSGGGARTSVASVCVRGDMKLGDYQTTYLDMDTDDLRHSRSRCSARTTRPTGGSATSASGGASRSRATARRRTTSSARAAGARSRSASRSRGSASRRPSRTSSRSPRRPAASRCSTSCPLPRARCSL